MPCSQSDRTPKWTAARQRGTEAAEASKKEYEAAKYETAKDDTRPLRALSGAELENALLAFYRALGRRMQTVAVRLIRELVRDEPEAKSLGEPEAPSPVVVGVSQSKENAQSQPSKK